MAITITEIVEDGIPYRITEDLEAGIYIKEGIQEITFPQGESELDIIGQQLVEKDLQILDLQSQNNLLGQQMVDIDLRLLQGGL